MIGFPRLRVPIAFTLMQACALDVRRYEILDTPPGGAFDDIARVTAKVTSKCLSVVATQCRSASCSR